MVKTISKSLPILLVILAALYSVWPMVRCPACIADYGRDGLLVNWILNTAGKNLYGLHSGIKSGLFDGRILYPYKQVLAYSDMLFLSSLWVYPAGVLLKNPAIVSGLALVIGQLATMLVIYLWWKKMSGNRWAAAIATIAFGLSQIRFEYQVHLQMWDMQYWLIGTWLIYSWLSDDKKKDRKLFIGAGILGLQVWESILPVYFAGLIILVKVLEAGKFWNKNIRKIFFAIIIFGIIAAVPLLAYWNVGHQFNYQRSIRDAANNSLAVNDIWKEFASPGLYILLILSIWHLHTSPLKFPSPKIGEGSEERCRNVRWLVLILFTSLVIAFGPVLKWGSKTVKIGGRLPIPLPYAVLYYTVPGFGALRTPSRWIWVSGWAASGIIAIGLSNSFSGLPPNLGGRRKEGGMEIAFALIGMLLIVIVGGKGIKYVRTVPSPREAPEVYKWLNGQPGKLMVILPMANQEWEMERLPFIAVHNKMTLNGFSGFYPPQQVRLGEELTDNFPNNNTFKELAELKVNWVVVDKTIYNLQCAINKEDCGRPGEIKKQAGKPAWEDSNYAVYKL
jgi:hypothetical protein